MDEIKKELNTEQEKQLLEKGEYELTGPGSNGIFIDELRLKSNHGTRRIWKLKEITPKQVIFDIVKF